MTVRTWTSSLSQATDADFRTWGSELSAELVNIGLVKTADTGQINWATAVRASGNSVAGYEIFRFNDSFQSTAPIFIKIEYGSGSAITTPNLWATVGSGSNGAGTLTGTVSDRSAIAINAAPSAGNYVSYLCLTEGFFGLLWKSGVTSGGNHAAFLAIARSVDVNGELTNMGCLIVKGSPSASATSIAQSLRFAAPATVYALNTAWCFFPGQPLVSTVDNDVQVYPVMGQLPRAYVTPFLAGVIVSEIPGVTTFQIAMIGSALRTLLSLNSIRSFSIGTGPGAISTYGAAMLWE